MSTTVRLTKAALDIFTIPGGKQESFILRGVLDPQTLQNIQVDTYQREVLSTPKIIALSNAIEKSTVPDIELGMRGDKYRVLDAGKADAETYVLTDNVYVIDGLQRITAARQLLQTKPDISPRLGAVVHFDTNFGWEKERFRILNQDRSKLSVNVLLRNMASDEDCQAIDMLYKLCQQDADFALHNRVQWSQNMLRTQILSALTLVKVVGVLHSGFGSGRSNQVMELGPAISKTMDKVGRTTMRDNVKEFFNLLDECWGVRRIVFTHGAIHMKGNFLLVLADILASHRNFWREHRLFIEKDLRMKIAKFPVSDVEIQRLACSNGKAREILFAVMLDYINSGKRSRRLTPADLSRARIADLTLSKREPAMAEEAVAA